MSNELTPDEAKAIKHLKAAEKVWPDSLWLFSASGRLHIVKKSEGGDRVILRNGGVDQDYVVGELDIENDGGDW